MNIRLSQDGACRSPILFVALYSNEVRLAAGPSAPLFLGDRMAPELAPTPSAHAGPIFWLRLPLCLSEQSVSPQQRGKRCGWSKPPRPETLLKMNGGRLDLRTKLTLWVPVILWASVIFFFSTDAGSASHTAAYLIWLLSAVHSGLTAEQIDSIHLIVRKFSHWAEYFIFALLILRALRAESRAGDVPKRHIALTLAAVAVYAVTDEVHQTLVASRTASLIDVMIDTFGGVSGIFWNHFHATHRGRLSPRIQKS
jgi:VanZ family protein